MGCRWEESDGVALDCATGRWDYANKQLRRRMEKEKPEEGCWWDGRRRRIAVGMGEGRSLCDEYIWID